MADESVLLLSLIAVASGFWVLLKSSKEEKLLKNLGAAIGWGVMGISLLLFLFSFYRIAFIRNTGRLGVMGRKYTGPAGNLYRREPVSARRFTPQA
ncbi:MAG TPA: hypothetical protein VJC03_05930, partial [bacterium]|nr:hypothetical protein [bacterium]